MWVNLNNWLYYTIQESKVMIKKIKCFDNFSISKVYDILAITDKAEKGC